MSKFSSVTDSLLSCPPPPPRGFPWCSSCKRSLHTPTFYILFFVAHFCFGPVCAVHAFLCHKMVSCHRGHWGACLIGLYVPTLLIQHLVPMCGEGMGGAHNKQLPRGPGRSLSAGLNRRWPFLLNNWKRSYSSHSLQAAFPDMPVLGAWDSRRKAGHRQHTLNPFFVLFVFLLFSHSEIISSAWSCLPWSLYGWPPSFLTSDISQRSLLS